MATELDGLIEGTGVYVLIYFNRIVYAGKATRVGLRTRLKQHARKVVKHGFSLDHFTCKALHIGESWLVRAGEDILIAHYAPAWNGTGFGNHTPGAGRPGIRQNEWESVYPTNKAPQ